MGNIRDRNSIFKQVYINKKGSLPSSSEPVQQNWTSERVYQLIYKLAFILALKIIRVNIFYLIYISKKIIQYFSSVFKLVVNQRYTDFRLF